MRKADVDRIQEALLGHASRVPDVDLLVYLLRNVLPPSSWAPTAESFLHSLGGIRGLSEFCFQRAQALNLADRPASVLLAAAELARRRVIWESRFPADHDDVLLNRYIRGLFRPGELVGALFLGSSRKVLGSLEVFRGRLHESAFDPKPMLREALALDAKGILLAHVEPSQDGAWNEETTWAVAERSYEACQSLGIELVDYRILGTYYVSLSSRRCAR